MFCPVGYRSAAELWHEYQDRRLRAVYVSAANAYKDHVNTFSHLRGSPLDICEFLFLTSLSEVGFYLASPKGNINRVFVTFANQRPSIFSVLTPLGSSYNFTAASLDKAYQTAVAIFKGSNFSSWQYDVSEQDSWTKTYPILSDEDYNSENFDGFPIRHHTLPNHFIRPSYLIANQVPPWAGDQAKNAEIQPILEHYAGWSICIDEVTYQGKWQEYLSGQKPSLANDAAIEKTARPGRPRLEKAYSVFASMGFDKGELSWAQLRAKIRRDTGEEPSDKALRNWRDQNLQGK